LCAASVAFVHARSRRVLTIPPARATRCASDGVLSTTITRWPSATRGREPTSPRQPAALVGGSAPCPAPWPLVASSTAVAATATSARRSACRGSARGVRIQAKITGVGDGLPKTGRRGEHRGVGGGEGPRRQCGVGERLAELGVRGDAADDSDSPAVRRLAHAANKRAHNRPLVRGGEV